MSAGSARWTAGPRRASLLTDGGVGLVAVPHRVDEPLVQGLARQERATVEQGPRVGRGLPPPFGDGAGQLVGHGLGQMLVLLPGRPGEAALGQRVRRGLVLLPLGRLEVHADLVQRRAKEQLLDHDAGEAEAAGGLQVQWSNAVAR